MSTILRALKRAEGSSGDKKRSPYFTASVSREKSRWLLIPVAVCVIALGYFLGTYLFKGAPAVAPPQGAAPKAAASVAAPLDSPAELNRRAIALIDAGKHAEAENLLRDALIKHPDASDLHNQLGLALKRQGRAAEALAEYEKALALKPDNFVAMNNLAGALEAAGQRTRAAELYRKALAGDPSMAGAHLNYALFLESEGRPGEAETHYHAFLALSKDEELKNLVRRRLSALR